MALISDVIELLYILTHSTADEMVKIKNNTLMDIKFFLQNSHEKIKFFQLESQLQQEESLPWSHHSGIVFVQDNPLFKTKTGSHKFPKTNQIIKVKVDSIPSTRANLHTEASI